MTDSGADAPPAVILGGEAIAMPVIRSLGRAGIDVWAVGNAGYDPGRHSRHRTRFIDIPSRVGMEGGWMDWLASEGPRGAAVLACADPGVDFIARNRQELVDLGYAPVEGTDSASLAMLDKLRTFEVARELGVDSPRVALVTSEAELEGMLDEIAYPCALKPRRSMYFQHHFGGGNKMIVAEGPRELREAFDRTHALGLEMLVTEIVPGEDARLVSYCGYLDGEGDPVTQCTFQKIRQYPPRFGLSCYAVSDDDAEVAATGLGFLRELGLVGLFEAEFKRDPRDGRLKLLECNPRFTILQLTFCPTDIAALAYARAVGRPDPPSGPYRPGTYLWNPVEDFRAYLAYRRDGEWSLGSWLRSLLHRKRLHVFRWSDPMPTVMFHLRRLGRLAGRLWGRGGPRPGP
jgi:D-aspartate ligase